MKIRRLDSVVFETCDLAAMRVFYGELLGLDVNTFEKDGEMHTDADERYVNFSVAGVLVGFEAAEAAQLGTMVFEIESLQETLSELSKRGIKPTREGGNWAIIRDPEGRDLILEQRSQPGLKS